MDKALVETDGGAAVLVQRIVSGLVAAGVVVHLIVEPGLRSALWLLAVFPMAIVTAIRPKAARDGRLQAWGDRHWLSITLGMSVYAGLGTYLVLSSFLDNQPSLAIGVVLGIAYCVVLVVSRKRRQRVG
jgi:hypothetical protein